MFTDRVPKKGARHEEYLRSDELRTIKLPPAEPLRTQARRIEEALAKESRKDVQLAANLLTATISGAFKVVVPSVKVLGVRPHEVTESSSYELFGDYDPQTTRIRLWMRTAVLQKPTSFGTFLHTLCHELCHHLDVACLALPETFHTRGFYERTALLYHHARGTPLKRLVWIEQRNGTYRINWPATMRGRGVTVEDA